MTARQIYALAVVLSFGTACTEAERESPESMGAEPNRAPEAPTERVPSVDYCEPLPDLGSSPLLAEENPRATAAVNHYLQKARASPEVVARICSVTTNFGRMYTAYDELYGASAGSGLGDETSIRATGTMALTPDGCWILLLDGGSSPYLLDPLPRTLMGVGQRVELTLSGPLEFIDLAACPFPTLSASNVRPAEWSIQPGRPAMAFEPEVRASLDELGYAATVTVDGTVIQVSGLEREQAWLLEESLRGRYGMFMVAGSNDDVHVWPAAEESSR